MLKTVSVILAAIFLVSASGQSLTVTGTCNNANAYFFEAGLSNVSTATCYAKNLNTTTQYNNLCSKCQTQLKSYRTKLNNDKNCTGYVPLVDASIYYDTKNGNYCGVLMSTTKITLFTNSNQTTFTDLYGSFLLVAIFAYNGYLNGSAAPVFTANSAMLNGTTNATCANASYCYVYILKNLYDGLYGTASGDSVVAAFGNATATCGVASTDLSNTCALGQFGSSSATHLRVGKFAIWMVLFSILAQSLINH
jgi:hypothetical protein